MTEKKCSCEHADAHNEQAITILDAFDRLRMVLSVSNLAVVLQGAEVRPIRTGGNSTQVAGAGGRVMGWSLHETSNVAGAQLYLRDARDGDHAGDIIAALSLAAGESTRDSWFPGGLSFINGLLVDVVSGSVEGAVYLGGAT